MSNESTTPGPEPTRGAQPDETGIIDLEHTRPVPRTDAPEPQSDPVPAPRRRRSG